MSSQQTLDDKIMCVVGMGFDLEDCQEAIQKGKVTVENIVEWILAGKPTSDPSMVGPPPAASSTLRLGSQSTNQPGADIIGSNQLMNTQPVASGSSVSMEEKEDEDKVETRFSINDVQRKVKEQFEVKQRLESQKQAKEEKLAKKKAKEEVLARLQEDKEARKFKSVASPQKLGGPSGSTSSQSPEKAQSASSTPATASTDKVMIQIRVPDGRALREQFTRTTVLQEVWQYVLSKFPAAAQLCLVQPFPRVEYGSSHMEKTLAELNLVPSGSLVLSKPQIKTQPAESMETAETESTTQEAPPHATPPAPPEPPAGPPHQWGGGHSMVPEAGPVDQQPLEGPADEEEMENSDSDSDEVGGGVMFPPGGGGGGGGMFPPGGLGLGMGMGGGAGHSHFWGEGQSLAGPILGVANNLPHQRQDPKQLAAEAARQRYTQDGAAGGVCVAMEVTGSNQSATVTEIPSLTSMLIQYLCSRICDPRNPLLSLQGVPADLAIKVIEYLVKNRLLKAKTLKPFLTCRLRKLILDCYPYVTNELLAAIRYHNYLQHLSLCSSPLITDKGLQPLAGLSRLKVLNLGGCKQLTNNCLPVIQEMKELVTLVLEDTGVTDDGVCTYAQCAPPMLHTLDLCRTSVTSHILQALPTISNLTVLNLEHTQVASLSGVQRLLKLEGLNVANTPIVTESLLCLQGHPALLALNISNTANVNGDVALQYIAGLKLKILNLPSRLTTSDTGIQYLVDMPLHTLDLTNYINVGDRGMEFVGRITTLKKLRLGNTKLTDNGLVFLEGLKNLEELLLDRTTVTDAGVEVAGALTRLQELSLSETGITNGLLRSGVLHDCVMLSKLNISKTQISDKGVVRVKFPHLTLLNVDETRISEAVANGLENSDNLPQLAKVTYRTLHTPPASDDEMQ